MTINSIFETGIAALVLSSFWIAFVLLVRRPVSRWFGARWAYYLWLVPLIGLLTLTMPINLARQQLGLSGLEIPGVDFVINEAVLSIEGLRPVQSSESTPTTIMSSEIIVSYVFFLWFLGSLASILTLAVRSFRYAMGVEPIGQPLSGEQQAKVRVLCPELAELAITSIRTTSSNSGPAVAGLFRPVLLLPVNFFDRYSNRQQELILRHEYQHVHRRDLLWLFVARVYRYLFWFNPLVYVAERYLQLDQELSCDEKVLSGQSDKTRRLYGETMLSSLNTHEPLPQVGYMPSFGQIKERMTMLKYHSHRVIGHVLGGVFVVMTSLVAIASYDATGSGGPVSEGPAMRQEIANQLYLISESLQSENANEVTFSSALENIQRLQTEFQEDSLTDYELAQFSNLSGYVHFLRNDYPSAIESYKRVVPLTDDVPELQEATLLTIAQLYASINKCESALQYVDRLIHQAEAQEKAPQDVWLSLRDSCQDKLEN